jgi:hypothetical protein
MKKNSRICAVEDSDPRDGKVEVQGLTETLQKVDRMLTEFYEIHGPHIKDQGQNQ